MEESEAATQKETTDNASVKVSTEHKANEATGEVSSQMSNSEPARKPPDETEARYNRLKLFEKVMQKSLEKFIEHVRYRVPRRYFSYFIKLSFWMQYFKCYLINTRYGTF